MIESLAIAAYLVGGVATIRFLHRDHRPHTKFAMGVTALMWPLVVTASVIATLLTPFNDR